MTEALVEKKIRLLQEQKVKADRLHELLNGPDGFNEVSRKTRKNLEVAIVVSKRPGYFRYYEQPEHARASIRNHDIEKLQKQLATLQKDIDHLTVAIEHETFAAQVQFPKDDQGYTSSSIQTLQHWFSTYGTPKQTVSDRYTTFAPASKIYGGTTHYSAFRSLSSTMKKGRLTK